MNIDTVIVGSVSAITGAVTAYFGFRGKQSDNDTKLSAKAFDAVLVQVQSLTEEVQMFRSENAQLTAEVKLLRSENTQINIKLNHAVNLLDSHNIDFSEGKIVEN
jgi:uncharacterized coiled-coil DUF342 family protein